jgi:hypothetical protein
MPPLFSSSRFFLLVCFCLTQHALFWLLAISSALYHIQLCDTSPQTTSRRVCCEPQKVERCEAGFLPLLHLVPRFCFLASLTTRRSHPTAPHEQPSSDSGSRRIRAGVFIERAGTFSSQLVRNGSEYRRYRRCTGLLGRSIESQRVPWEASNFISLNSRR